MSNEAGQQRGGVGVGGADAGSDCCSVGERMRQKCAAFPPEHDVYLALVT